MMNRGTIIISYALLCLIWSSTWIMIKIGLEGAPPLAGAGIRFIIAFIVIFSIIRLKKIRLPVTRKFLVLSVFLGLFQMGIPYALVYWGEQHISAGLTAVLFSVMPLTVALLARVILGDPLTAMKLAGIFLGTAGVVVIFSDSLEFGGEMAIFGMVAVLSSAFFASLSSVLIKKHSFEYNPFASLLLPKGIGAAFLIIASVALERGQPIRFDPLTVTTFFYLALFGSVIAFALYFWLIKYIDVTILVYQTLIIPVLACLLDWIFLGETVTSRLLIGGGLILMGIALAVLRKPRTQRT